MPAFQTSNLGRWRPVPVHFPAISISNDDRVNFVLLLSRDTNPHDDVSTFLSRVSRARERERECRTYRLRRPRGVSVRERAHPHSNPCVCFIPVCMCTYRCVEGTKRTRFTLARTLLREWLKDSLPDPSSSFSSFSFSFSFLFFPPFLSLFPRHSSPSFKRETEPSIFHFTKN